MKHYLFRKYWLISFCASVTSAYFLMAMGMHFLIVIGLQTFVYIRLNKHAVAATVHDVSAEEFGEAFISYCPDTNTVRVCGDAQNDH